MMEKAWIVTGGRELSGKVRISGFKHSVPPVIAAALATNGSFELTNVPDVEDVKVLSEILYQAGAEVTHDKKNQRLRVNPTKLCTSSLSSDLTSRVHGTLYLVPGILARLGHVKAGPFGGCKIADSSAKGERPLHHICEVMQRFGAKVTLIKGCIEASCKKLSACCIDMADFADLLPNGQGLSGPLYSGATKTAIICAVSAEGITKIHHPYRKGDVGDLLQTLTAAGTHIEDDGTTLRIEGRPHIDPFRFELSSDAIEVITYISLAAYLSANIKLAGIAERTWPGLEAELRYFEQMGLVLDRTLDTQLIFPQGGYSLAGIDISVASHGIFSDSQPFFSLLLSVSKTGGMIEETVWTNRFGYMRGLVQLGATMECSGNTLRVSSKRPNIPGMTVHGKDLRAVAALVVAALGINGQTTIYGIEHLKRGYADLLGQLRQLGAQVDEI